MRMACDLDVNSDLTNFFVQNIDDELEIVVEKKTNQSEKEWGKCLKEISVLTIQIKNQEPYESRTIQLKVEKSSSAIMKATDRGKRFKKERYLSADDIFVANTEKIQSIINEKGNKTNGGWHKQSKL